MTSALELVELVGIISIIAIAALAMAAMKQYDAATTLFAAMILTTQLILLNKIVSELEEIKKELAGRK